MSRRRPLAFDTARTARLLYAYAARLTAIDASNPKWIQLCTAGRYVYRGRKVEITAEVFDAMVRNFRAHPAFDAGSRELLDRTADEAAKVCAAITSGVIALNFDHPPWDGPRPGHGWFLDVERRAPGEGPAELWGLVWLDGEAHEGLVSLRWKWCSIEWDEDAVDNQGRKIGPYLYGVAFTNDPFVTGMAPIQLSRDAGDAGPIVLTFGPAVEVLCELRRLLQLPETAGVQEVIAEVAKLRTWALGELPAPLGVDVAGLVGAVRRVLILPALSDPASIFRELDKLLARLAAEDQEEKDMDKPPTTDPIAALARAFTVKLASRAGMAAPEDPLAFDALGSKYEAAIGHYQALSQMLGSSDPKELTAKIASLIALSEQVTQLLGEVKADHEAEETAEGEAAAADVGQVMQAQRLDPALNRGAFEAYKAQRLGFAQPLAIPTVAEAQRDPGKIVALFAALRTRREQRAKARAAFFSVHGITDLARVQDALPPHLKGALLPALFSGHAPIFGPGAPPPPPPPPPPQPIGAAYFGPGAPPASPHAWSRARLAALPPAENDGMRVVHEIVRTEHGGTMPAPGTAAYSALHARSSQILLQLSRES